MEMAKAIQSVIDRRSLSDIEMRETMMLVMSGQATPAQIGGFLVGLRMKGETVEEITAAATVMRSLAIPVTVAGDHVLDTCGTGGDGAHTFNISTAAAFVAAAAGAKVAKHGNRSVSSRSGSADVLESLGVNLELTPDQVVHCIEQTGIGFMFAPRHHSAMRHAVGPRREMGVRTLFNLLGPLTNPAQAPHQILGVFAEEWLLPLAEVLHRLGSRHVLVVHAADGLDEISISATTQVAELHYGRITRYSIAPENFGLNSVPLSAISANSVEMSKVLLQQALENVPGPALDVVVLNAGAAIYAADLTSTWEQGIEKAYQVIAQGDALRCLTNLVKISQSFNDLSVKG